MCHPASNLRWRIRIVTDGSRRQKQHLLAAIASSISPNRGWRRQPSRTIFLNSCRSASEGCCASPIAPVGINGGNLTAKTDSNRHGTQGVTSTPLRRMKLKCIRALLWSQVSFLYRRSLLFQPADRGANTRPYAYRGGASPWGRPSKPASRTAKSSPEKTRWACFAVCLHPFSQESAIFRQIIIPDSREIGLAPARHRRRWQSVYRSFSSVPAPDTLEPAW